MTWPWVRRASAEQLRFSLIEAQAREEETRRRALATEQRYDALLEKYHALASPPPSALPDATGHADLAPRLQSVIALTIKAESGGDPRLAAHLRKRATELKREGKTDEEIAQQLGTWQTTEDDTAAA